MSEKTRVVIAGLEAKNGIHTIVSSDGKRFGFFETDQSKQFETPQYEQFRKLHLKNGDTVDIEWTARTYINKFGKTVQAANMDSISPVTATEAKEAVVQSEAKNLKVTLGKCATLYLQARLQGGATFDEVDREVGRAVQLAIKVTDVIDDLFGDGETSRTLGSTQDGETRVYADDGTPVPF